MNVESRQFFKILIATYSSILDYDGCVDVSTYSKVKYHQVTKEHCEIKYKKIIHDRHKEVCILADSGFF